MRKDKVVMWAAVAAVELPWFAAAYVWWDRPMFWAWTIVACLAVCLTVTWSRAAARAANPAESWEYLRLCEWCGGQDHSTTECGRLGEPVNEV